MPDRYGSSYSSTDPLKKAPGTRCDAGVRSSKNIHDLAGGLGGTTDRALVAVLPQGSEPVGMHASCSANASAINLIFGTDADDDEFVTTAAGPAAGATVNYNLTTAAQKAAARDTPVYVWAKPSGNWPASGDLILGATYTKR